MLMASLSTANTAIKATLMKTTKSIGITKRRERSCNNILTKMMMMMMMMMMMTTMIIMIMMKKVKVHRFQS